MVKFKAIECFSSTFQGKFNFQELFKTVLNIQVFFKHMPTLLWCQNGNKIAANLCTQFGSRSALKKKMDPNVIPERKEYSNNKWGTSQKFYLFGALLFQEPPPKSRTVVSLELSGRTLDFYF